MQVGGEMPGAQTQLGRARPTRGSWLVLASLALPSSVLAAGRPLTPPASAGSPAARTTLAPLLDSPPTITLGVPGEAPLGADVSFSVTFDNTDPSDPGFGPVLDIILDTTGADGDDGLGTTSISAEYANILFTTGGANPTMWVRTFNGAGQATHPLFRELERGLHHGQRDAGGHAGRAAPALWQLRPGSTAGDGRPDASI